jgi:hypothetical protein
VSQTSRSNVYNPKCVHLTSLAALRASGVFSPSIRLNQRFGSAGLSVLICVNPWLKTCFLPNEPKVVQCLPKILKNKVLTNRIRIDQNRYETPSNEVETPHLDPENDPFYTSMGRENAPYSGGPAQPMASPPSDSMSDGDFGLRSLRFLLLKKYFFLKTKPNFARHY